MNASSGATRSRFFTRRNALLGMIAMLGGAACASGPGGLAAYGAKVRFAKDVTIAFPDFDLTYLGRRHVASPVFKPGFNNEDFKLSRAGKSITISWSSGTGLIAPRGFEFNGRPFTLELRHANRYQGWLKDDELVIEKK